MRRDRISFDEFINKAWSQSEHNESHETDKNFWIPEIPDLAEHEHYCKSHSRRDYYLAGYPGGSNSPR